MADPFEVRLGFMTLLNTLNASAGSGQRAANYAMRNWEMHEDLHSCILEQLHRTSLNARVNIMFFAEQLCVQALQQRHPEYLAMVQRDIEVIVDYVVPGDGSGSANVKTTLKVLHSMHARELLTADKVAELEQRLVGRDRGGAGAASPAAALGDDDVPTRPAHSLTRQQIEQRIEEDRERHKRDRENIWSVDAEEEFDRLWDEVSEIGDADFIRAESEATERREAMVRAR